MEDFYSIDGRFFILVGSEEIEVNELIYKKCRSIDNNTKYLDRKYNKWNTSFDDNSLVLNKFESTVSKRSVNIEEDFVFKDEVKERLKKLNKIDKVIVKRLLDGYSETEIANELSISRQSINKRKQRIREVI